MNKLFIATLSVAIYIIPSTAFGVSRKANKRNLNTMSSGQAIRSDEKDKSDKAANRKIIEASRAVKSQK